MITKEAMAKVAAADERDHAGAIDFGFELACADMHLDRSRATALAKVAMARIAEFKKLAADAQAPVPAPNRFQAGATLEDLGSVAGKALTSGPIMNAVKGPVGGAVRAVKPWVSKNLVTPMQRSAEGIADVVGRGAMGLGDQLRSPALKPAFGNLGKALKRWGDRTESSWPLGRP